MLITIRGSWFSGILSDCAQRDEGLGSRAPAGLGRCMLCATLASAGSVSRVGRLAC